MGWLRDAVMGKPQEMTLETFFGELANVREKFEWRLEPDGGPDSERREWARFQIHAFSDQSDAEDTVFSPIGAVCYALTGKIFNVDDWSGAAEAVGLPPEDAERLNDAANDRTWKEIDGRRRPNTDLQALRVEIIRAVETPAQAINL